VKTEKDNTQTEEGDSHTASEIQIETAANAPLRKRRLLLAGWPELLAFFCGYDLIPWREHEYLQEFSNGSGIHLRVIHFPKILLFHGGGCSWPDTPVDMNDPVFDRESSKWWNSIYELETALVRFDLNKGRRLTNNESLGCLMVFYEPGRTT
jgi:hypothetical protein